MENSYQFKIKQLEIEVKKISEKEQELETS